MVTFDDDFSFVDYGTTIFWWCYIMNKYEFVIFILGIQKKKFFKEGYVGRIFLSKSRFYVSFLF